MYPRSPVATRAPSFWLETNDCTPTGFTWVCAQPWGSTPFSPIPQTVVHNFMSLSLLHLNTLFVFPAPFYSPGDLAKPQRIQSWSRTDKIDIPGVTDCSLSSNWLSSVYRMGTSYKSFPSFWGKEVGTTGDEWVQPLWGASSGSLRHIKYARIIR